MFPESLNLKHVSAYTVVSSDNEYTRSEKGLYRSQSVAAVKAQGAGWYGAAGRVEAKLNVYKDESTGKLYEVVLRGKYTDDEDEFKEQLKASIRSKLTEDELKLIGLK